MSTWPEPEVWARPAKRGEVPRGASGVVKAAEAAGWAAQATYARGTYRFPKKPPAVVDSVLVRLAHPDGRRAAAHWLDGGFADAYAWSPAHSLRKLGANNLKLALAADGWPTSAEVAATEGLGPMRADPPALTPRPAVPGSWGTVHVGDVVRGADQRPWMVVERGPALRWVVAGESADFTLHNDERGEVTIRRGLADPCDVMTRDNHAATAAAVAALIDAGLNVEIVREHIATPEQQATAQRVAGEACCGGWSGPGGIPEDCGRTCPLGKTYCAYCDYDTHLCPACGTSVEHGRIACAECSNVADVHPDINAGGVQHAGADGSCPNYGSHLDPCPPGCASGTCVAAKPPRAERPCDDPFCGPGGCGWAPADHMPKAATTPAERARVTTEEREPVGDQFQAAVPQVRFDRFGRYLLPDPTTGKERAWTRVSTVARTIADEYNLTQWKMRMVAKGVAIRPDLIAGAAAADPERDRSDLQEIAGKAMEAAEAGAGATFGTALHNFTRRIDTGEAPESLRVPSALLSPVKAYLDCLRAARLTVEHAERIVCLPDLGVAGEFDRIVRQPPGVTNSLERSILDLKSGKDLSYGWLEIVIQQALYARARLMWDPGAQAWVPMPDVDLARALILHLPVGQGRAQLYGVNILEGWRLAQLALQVRAERTNAKKLAWVVEPDDPASVALHLVQRASSQQELAALWDRFNKAGGWTEEVNTAAHARMAQLQQQPATV